MVNNVSPLTVGKLELIIRRVHVVNIVTLDDGVKYMVDVGFGGDGATKPLPLVHGHISTNLGSQEVRIAYDNIPGQMPDGQKLWVYQYRNGPSLPWNSFYCFPELEFLAADFEVMNYFTSTSPDSFQPITILAVRFLRRDQKIYGKVMLVDGQVKENTGGKTRVRRLCSTEQERVEALEKDFGIILTPEEISGIRGTVTELIRR
jgi:arylamine N-acetyltransferase